MLASDGFSIDRGSAADLEERHGEMARGAEDDVAGCCMAA
jgi:hypothetical protein